MTMEQPRTTVTGKPIPDGAIPAKGGFLMPRWPKGTSGNARGLAKDGGGCKDHPIRATLRKQLAKRRNLRRLVDTWIDAACDGDSAAREQILKRLDPVLEDNAASKTILEGLRLELGPGTASLTLGRASGDSLPLASAQKPVVEEGSCAEDAILLSSEPAPPAASSSPDQGSTTAEPARTPQTGAQGLGDGQGSES